MKVTSARSSLITILVPLPTTLTMKSSLLTQILTTVTLAQSLPVKSLPVKSLPVTAPASPAVKGRVRVNSLSMTVHGNVTT